MILPVIMAGGSGSRLWPMSRHEFPKQFLNLGESRSMLQATLNRIGSLDQYPSIIICNEVHRFIVAEQLRAGGFEGANIILEPEGKNTAPAIALAAFKAIAQGDDPVLLVLAADHLIKNEEVFCKAVERGVSLAEDNKLITFGIVPTKPETGFGYIRRGEELVEGGGHLIAEFVEKPAPIDAQHYLESGEFFWNSGMFMFKASRYLAELREYREDIYASCENAIKNTTRDLDFVRVDREVFCACPEESIDYAVMEHTNDGVVIPVDCGWSDVGSWSALWEVSDKDESGNVIDGEVMAFDCSNSYFCAQEKMVAAIGLEDVVVVDTKDALLVAKMSEVQRVKEVVKRLKEEGLSEWLRHREVYRPWGKYDSIDSGHRFQVKRITVKPGEKLSEQMHHHRAEHWVVVSGTASVVAGDKTYLLTENQSTYIPLGVKHSLENPGKVPLEIIEIQSGSYLGEDDIVRFKDNYGRA